MTHLRNFLAIFAVIILCYPMANTADTNQRMREQELAARLRWEILWNDTPLGFRISKTRSIKITMYQTGNAFWYCSRSLGVCAQYSLDEHQLGQRISSIRYENERTAKDFLLRYASESQKQPFSINNKTSTASKSVGTLWTSIIELATRDDIVKQYKQLRPIKLKELREWLRTRHKDTGYRSITIACFLSSDPTVFIYGDRPPERFGPIVFQVFWDKERKEWVVAGILEQSQSLKKFEELKSTVQSIACDRIRFK